jgi:cytoskeletal protein CcmA (bactofilin family)
MADPKTGFTTIGPTLVIRGTLKTREKLVIRGRIDAAIVSTELVQIDKDGIVRADITASALLVNGVVVGNITAEKHLELGPDARVIGDISSPVLVIQDGAALRGKIAMPGVDEAMEAPYQEPEAMPLRPVVRTTAAASHGEQVVVPPAAQVPRPDLPVAAQGIYPVASAGIYPTASAIYPAIEEIEVGEGADLGLEIDEEPDEETRPVDQPRITMRPGRFKAGASSRLTRSPTAVPAADLGSISEPGTAPGHSDAVTPPGSDATVVAAPSSLASGTGLNSAGAVPPDPGESSGIAGPTESASASHGVGVAAMSSSATGRSEDLETQKKPRKRFW